VAWKEFVHIWRDRRVLVLLLLVPPLFTLLLGHAFEVTDLVGARAILVNADQPDESRRLESNLRARKEFHWIDWKGDPTGSIDLLSARAKAAVVIPRGWGAGLRNGEPLAIRLVADGTDTTTAPAIEGAIREALGEFQLTARDTMIENLPSEVIDLGEKLPEAVRKEFVSWMEPWAVNTEVLYNPKLRFVDFVIPGIVGLILQLLTVTLIACTIAREREMGTLSQLLVTPLDRTTIVVGKVIPHFVISALLIVVTLIVGFLHFGIPIRQPEIILFLSFLFLLCSLGLGLLISAVARTQIQAIQFSLFFLLPMLLLSGAFAPLDQLPHAIQALSELFPLTHFCRAFRTVNLGGVGIAFIIGDLVFLTLGAIGTGAGAAFLLGRMDE
jgi:ABC-2 type transport system permease protein